MGLLRFNRPVMSVSDVEKTILFYRDLLGMRVVADSSTTDADKGGIKVAIEKAWSVSNLNLRWVVMEAPGEGAGREIEFLQWNSPKSMAPLLQRNCYDDGIAWGAFRVEGMKELYNKMISKGVKFLAPLVTSAGRGSLRAIDPDGYIVELGSTL